MTAASVLELVNTLSAINAAITNLSETGDRVSAIFERAQAEGRDLNEEELAEIRTIRDSAMARWNEGG